MSDDENVNQAQPTDGTEPSAESDREAVRAFLARAEMAIDGLRQNIEAHEVRMLAHEEKMEGLVVSIGAHVDRLESEISQTIRRYRADLDGVIAVQQAAQKDTASMAQVVSRIDELTTARVNNLAARIADAEEGTKLGARRADALEGAVRAVDANLRDGFRTRDEELRRLRETAVENRRTVRQMTSKYPDVPDPDEITNVRRMPTIPTIEQRLAAVALEQAEAKVAAEKAAYDRARRDSDRVHARWSEAWRLARKALTHVVIPVAVAVGLAAAVVASTKIKACGGVAVETKEQKR